MKHSLLNAVARRIANYAACLLPGVVFLLGVVLSPQAARSQALVGQWMNGTQAATNFLDVSGYSLAHNHGVYLTVDGGDYYFTNDVPPGKSGYSIDFYDGSCGLAVSNSSNLDPAYDTTFDDGIDQSFTASLWAKGFPGAWNPFVSKWGEETNGSPPGAGWQLRVDNSGQYACFSVRDNGGGANNGNGIALGVAEGEAPLDDMATTTIATGINGNSDGTWHLYTAVFDANTGIRAIYVDAKLAALESSGNVAYNLAPFAHLCFNAKDSPPGNSFGNSSIMELYDLRMYNYAVSSNYVLTNLYGVVPAAITIQPAPALGFVGSPVKINASTSGSGPLYYQWFLNNTNVNLLADSNNFSGGNSGTLTILNLQPADVGNYQLLVTNILASVLSSNAFVGIQQPALVGRWFNGPQSLSDVSGYCPPGTHDASLVDNGTGSDSYSFSSDVPPGKSGNSVSLPSDSSSGFEIENSSTLDANYTNTYDTAIHGAMTVAFWAKGWPGGWNPWVSKLGDNGVGWQLREDGQNGVSPVWTIRGNAGTVTLGTPVYGSAEDMAATSLTYGNDNAWHVYVGTYNSGTGIRALWVDGSIAAYETNNGLYALATPEHVCIGAKDSPPGSTFGNYFNGELYDVQIYNYDLSSNQVFAYSAVPDPSIMSVLPASVTNYVGGTAQMKIVARALSTPVTYQWYLGGVPLTNGFYKGALVAGANSTALTISLLTQNLQGEYTFSVTDAGGSKTTVTGTALTVLPIAAPPPVTNLVGAWFLGGATMADTSGYSPAGTHDTYPVAGTGLASATNFAFSTDTPVGQPGVSLNCVSGLAALAVSNSSTLDVDYTNTFDDGITNEFTVTFWARGWPGGWNPWVSKYGEGPGWQLRNDGNNNVSPCWTVRGAGGTVTVGSSVYGNPDDCAAVSLTYGNDGKWHNYAGTYNANTGIRNLYVDGDLVGQVTNCLPYSLATEEHLTIGGKDSPPGNTFGNYFQGKIYGVRIYDVELSQAQVNGFLARSVPAFSPKPTLSGNNLVLSWTSGTLLQSTNLAGPWTPTGATSPYTNNISTAPQMFFQLSD